MENRLVLMRAAVLLSISPFAQSSAGVTLTSGTNSAGRRHLTHCSVAHQEECCVSRNTEKTPAIDNLRKLTVFHLTFLAMVEGNCGRNQHR